jgi:aspartyl aminopeptidase
VRELHRRYGLTAADLEASELYLVPKARAREVGLDRAMIGAHGQDDRSNSWAAWRAIRDLDAAPARSAMVWLVDREEIGSSNTTGAKSRFLELVTAWLLRAEGAAASELGLERAFARSSSLSADSPAAIDPNWPDVHEVKNAPVLGGGPALFPFTGRGGKSGGSSASAEQMAEVAALFERAKVPLQYGELGRVDEGGGGTIASVIARRGIETVDVGIAVVAMHSPLEVTAIEDLWSTYRGFRAWLED